MVNFTALNYSPGYEALMTHSIKENQYFMLVYKANDSSSLDILQVIYDRYVANREPPALHVLVVATCIDTLPANGREALDPGKEFAAKYGWDHIGVSAKTAEGCGELEAAIRDAVVRSRGA